MHLDDLEMCVSLIVIPFFSMVEPEEESDEDDEPYLHPSLASSLTKIEAVRFARYTYHFCTLYINLFLKMHKWSPCALVRKNFAFMVFRNVKIPSWATLNYF